MRSDNMKFVPSKKFIGLLCGLGLTSVSLSSGFIWACGSSCISDPLYWSRSTQPVFVFGAGFTAWWGYLLAHYAWTGNFIDASAHDDKEAHNSVDRPSKFPLPTVFGVVMGVGILILGMVIGVIYIRQGNHLLTNVGGVFFLSGFVIAHYFETGAPL